MAISATSSPLLGGNADGGGDYYVEGAIDFKGRRAVRSRSGGWRSSFFIIGVEMSERFAYYGISSNLITYLTGKLHFSNASAAENVNVWAGVGWMLPLLGAFVADAWLGKYKTIIFSSLIYVLGLVFLTLSAVLPFGFKRASGISSRSPSNFEVALFFFSLYLVAIGQGGHKPCLQAFGADQFDETIPEEQKSKSSFFNWWYFALCFANTVSILVLNYIQEDIGWGLGYGIPCLSMALGLIIFLGGTFTYRISLAQEEGPFTRILQVFVAAFRKSRWPVEDFDSSSGLTRQFRFLNKAAIPLKSDHLASQKRSSWLICSVAQVEEGSTFFTKQASTMDRTIGPSFVFPAAALQCFIGISIILFIPIYEGILVPLARHFTGISSGITVLQRLGAGMFLSALYMAVAALVERRRLEIAREADLIDLPTTTVPMKIWWLLPQYLICGLADVFTIVGLQEFFYDEMPETLRSMGIALYLSTLGVGYFLSSFLISLLEKLSSATGGTSWFSNNLNKAHLDYFYWLLAGLSVLELCLFMFLSRSYVYKSRRLCFKDLSQPGSRF
ncbi:unnamed protein product [Victoria cruziana]